MKWIDYGTDILDEGLGRVIGKDGDIIKQWVEKLQALGSSCKTGMKDLETLLSTTAKVRLIQGAYASKVAYTQEVQVPASAEALLTKTQRILDRAVMGKYPFITHEMMYQPWEDGGLGHVHMWTRAKASWGALAIQLIKDRDSWKDIWWETIEKVYGKLTDAELIRGTCSFKKNKMNSSSTELQRRALEALGELPPPRRRRTVPAKQEEHHNNELGNPYKSKNKNR